MKCVYCGKEIENARKNQKYCSTVCTFKARYARDKEKILAQNKASRDRKKLKQGLKKCALCGKPIEGRNYRAKYCSEECRRKVSHERETKRRKEYKCLTERRKTRQEEKPIRTLAVGLAEMRKLGFENYAEYQKWKYTNGAC